MQPAPPIPRADSDQPAEAGFLGVATVPLPCEDNERQGLHGDAPDRFIYLPEVAKMLDVSTRSIQRLIAEGQFPRPVKVGRTPRWRLSDIGQHQASLRVPRKARQVEPANAIHATGTDLAHAEGHERKPADERSEKGLRLLFERKLTIPQAARGFGIGASSLRRIIAEGRLPVLKMQRKLLILESDAEAFLRESRVTVKENQNISRRLPSLPKCVAESEHLR